MGSHHIYKINFNKYVILIKIIFHFYFFQNKAVPSADIQSGINSFVPHAKMNKKVGFHTMIH